MKKTFTLTLATVLATAICCTAMASPLRNFSRGKIAIDAGGNLPTSMEFTEHKTFGKPDSCYGGLTLGLGSRSAINAGYDLYKVKHDNKVRTQQLNLMYQLLPQLTAYAGYVDTNTQLNGVKDSTHSGQIGLQGSFKIPLVCTIWGRAAVGNKLTTTEVGVSRSLLNNIDLNLSYYDNRFKKLPQGGELKAKGVKAGLTVKF